METEFYGLLGPALSPQHDAFMARVRGRLSQDIIPFPGRVISHHTDRLHFVQPVICPWTLGYVHLWAPGEGATLTAAHTPPTLSPRCMDALEDLLCAWPAPRTAPWKLCLWGEESTVKLKK